MALFVLASKDGWVQLMYTGLDAVGIDQQVRRLAAATTHPPACCHLLCLERLSRSEIATHLKK